MPKRGPVTNFAAYIYMRMLESKFWYHLSAFQELETVPPQELETVPPLEGTIFTLQKLFFEDFCDRFWCQLVFFSFLALAQLVTSFFLFIIFSKCFFFLVAIFIECFRHCVSTKHYKKVFLERVSSFRQLQKTWFTNCKLVCHKKCI